MILKRRMIIDAKTTRFGQIKFILKRTGKVTRCLTGCYGCCFRDIGCKDYFVKYNHSWTSVRIVCSQELHRNYIITTITH